MAKIKILPAHEAQKIAAGEVIERPATIVKELIENALDALSTHITIEIKDGGKQGITVIDNGCGMDSHDAQLCFAKHATSKIESIADLERISSFGFRGEALASIAAVSQVTLRTKETDAQEGTQVTVSAGNITAQNMVACPVGTAITISDLFYTVPARKKFLKARETEFRHIQALIQAFCFAYPSTHFKFISDDAIIYNCPPVTNLLDRYTQLHAHTTTTHMQSLITYQKDSLQITGAVSDITCTRFDRSGIFLFVNKRWIRNQKLSSAVIAGYASTLQPGRFPLACIEIAIDPTEVDINIHPRKEEVQFVHPRSVEQAVQQTVKQTLETALAQRIKQPVHFEQPRTFFTSPMQGYQSFSSPHVPPTPVIRDQPFFIPPAFDHTIQHQHPIIQPSEQSYRLIGQYHKTYLLIEQDDGLFLIDQHAAHERILYEEFATRFDSIPSVALLFPIMIHISKEAMELLTPHLALFATHNIILEPFGEEQLIIQSIPVHLKETSLDELIHKTVAWISDYNHLKQEEFFSTMNHNMRAQMACSAAVKAGDELTQEKMNQLLQDLFKTPNRLSCPHGRPTGWLLPLYEIEKKFKRK